MVENELTIANMLERCLAEADYQIRIVNQGHTAIVEYEKWQPSLILLDISLPDLSGLDVSTQMRANESTIRTPIIFLTQQGDHWDKTSRLRFGPADDYLIKPFHCEELRRRVQQALTRSTSVSH